MSATIGPVAVNTFREAVRDRVLYNLVLFALLMIGAAILVGQISIGIERLVIINLGLSAISLFGLVMAIFIGVGLVYKEIEKRTLYSLLAKPIRRWQFLVGKYAGLLLTLAVNTAFMTLGLAAALFYVGGRVARADVSILVAIYFILLEFALVTALALFFSCFSSPMLSTLFTLGIYITGVFANDIHEFGEFTQNAAVLWLTRAIYYRDSQFSQLQRYRRGRARRGDSVLADLAEHAVCGAVRRAASIRGLGRILPAESEMSSPQPKACAVGPRLWACRCFLQRSPRCKSKIDARAQPYDGENEQLLLRSASAVRRMSLGYDALARGYLLDARRAVLRRQRRHSRREIRSAVAAARYHHHARSEAHRRLPLWRDFSFRASPRRGRAHAISPSSS